MTGVAGALAKHTAAPQLAGYVYQLQQATLRLFELAEGESLGIELLDDLHIAADGAPADLHQVKYHGDSQAARLGNKSVEFWKTLGIWVAAVQDASLDLTQVRRLALITRASLVPDSIPALLARGESADKVVSQILLLQSTMKARAPESLTCLCSLSRERLLDLVGKVAVFADQPGLAETVDVLRKRLRFAGFHEKRLDDAVHALSGWMWVRIVQGLSRGQGVLIGEDEFHNALSHVRDDLTENALPVRYAEAVPDTTELAGQVDMVYIRQLQIVGAGESAVRRAIVHFFRATHERVEWLRRGDILPDQLRRFDNGLVERWGALFDAMLLSISNADDAEALRKKGLAHLLEIEALDSPLQGRLLDHYVTCGSYHALADRVTVGWHPHFRELLAATAPPLKEHQ